MKKLLLLFLTLVFWGCQSKISEENALAKLQSLSQYNCYYYAPMHIGRAVLTGENHDNPDKYIASKYGKLIDKGLIKVTVNGKNAWRTSIDISLTDAAKSMCDGRRSDAEHAFVAVCKVRPITVDTVIVHAKDSVECKYVIQQSDVTDFGEFLGYQNGKTYNVKHIF